MSSASILNSFSTSTNFYYIGHMYFAMIFLYFASIYLIIIFGANQDQMTECPRPYFLQAFVFHLDLLLD